MSERFPGCFACLNLEEGVGGNIVVSAYPWPPRSCFLRTSRTITTRTFGCLGTSRTITTRTITTRTVFQNHTKGTTVSHIFASEVCRTLRNSILLTYCIQMAGGPAARFADKSQVAETIRSHSSSPWHSFVSIFPAPRPGILWITQFSFNTNSIGSMEDQGIHGIR